MFELGPGVGSGNLETRSCRAGASGSFLKAVDTKGKQEMAKEEKLSIMDIVLEKTGKYASLSIPLLFLGTWDDVTTPYGHLLTGSLSSWNSLW